MKKTNIRQFLRELGKTLLMGLGAAAVCGVCAFLIGLPVHGFSVWEAVGEVRRWLLIVGALLLFVCAGLLLADKKAGRLQESEKWKSHFAHMGLAMAVGLAAIVILLSASAVDALLLAHQ